MEYQVEIRGQHKVVYSAKDSPNGEFERVSRDINLSHTNLFLDPNRPGAPTALIPLESETRTAFAALEGLTDSSPVVEALKRFGAQQLDRLLEATKNPAHPDLIVTDIFTKPENKPVIERALKAAVKAIDKELPHYFSSEKQLGTYPWLASGADEKKLPCTLAAKRPIDKKDETTGEKLLTDLSGRFIEYDADKKVAFVLSDTAIRSADILEALCNSGTLGNGALEVNKAAALTYAAYPAIESARGLKKLVEIADQGLTRKPPSLLRTVAGALAPAALVTLTSVPVVVADIIQNSIGVTDLVLTGLFVATALMARKTLSFALQNRKFLLEPNPTGQEFAAALKKASTSTLAKPLTTLAMAAIDQIVSQSAGHAVTTLAPKGVQSWLHDLPSVESPDHSLLPTEKIVMMGAQFNVPVRDNSNPIAELTELDDFSGHRLSPPQSFEVSFPDVAHIYSIDRASESWNTLHATSLIREFAERHNLQSKDTPSANLQALLESSLMTPTDTTQTFPTVSQPFTALTAHFKLNRATWDQISRALASAVLLERLAESRRAQEIAQAALKQALS